MVERSKWQRASDAVQRLASGRRGVWGVAVAAFLESSVLPFPMEVVLVTAMLSNRARAWQFATAALAGCLLASAMFYGIGALLYQAFGETLAQWLGYADGAANFRERLQGEGVWQGFWAIFAVSFLPMPLQVATLGSGIVGYPFVFFIAAVATSRFLRFHGLAALTLFAGPQLKAWMGGLSPVTRGVLVVGVGSVVAATWLFGTTLW